MSRTPASPEFDPRIAEWLEHDPDHAPGEVLRTVLAAYPSIPQRRASRAPWRLPPMHRFALLGAAAVTVAVVGAGGLLLASRASGPAAVGTPSVSPSAAPSTSPSASPGSPAQTPFAVDVDPSPDPGVPAIPTFAERTVSTPSGLSLGYPTGWTSTSGSEGPESLALTWEAVPGQVPFAYLSAKSAPLGTQTADEWIASAVGSGGECPRTGHDEVMIGGQEGILKEFECPLLGGRHRYRGFAVAGQRGYIFQMDTTILDQAWFEALLASVDFDTDPANE